MLFFLVVSWTFQRFEYGINWFIYETKRGVKRSKPSIFFADSPNGGGGASSAMHKSVIKVLDVKLYIPRLWSSGSGISACYSRTEIAWCLIMVMMCVTLYTYQQVDDILTCNACASMWICQPPQDNPSSLYGMRYFLIETCTYAFWIATAYIILSLLISTLYNHLKKQTGNAIKYSQLYIPVIDFITFLLWMLSIPTSSDVFEAMFWIMVTILWAWNAIWSLCECLLIMKFEKLHEKLLNCLIISLIAAYVILQSGFISFSLVLDIYFDGITIEQLFWLFFFLLGIAITLPIVTVVWVCAVEMDRITKSQITTRS